MLQGDLEGLRSRKRGSLDGLGRWSEVLLCLYKP